ncbi:M28 family peptidase [Cytophagaceae bacterium YF14B1]|uniref:M28 family peptidase n=1 Tax=Xanthocytophaga flava TaxID=3048013 RepID=A0AAE3QIY5_9BACT|nr:M28 family peptidase [Xanthocytophaga flavus]MDJ1479481.1 M28 family peptidase [Xanthocytophaga flavus]
MQLFALKNLLLQKRPSITGLFLFIALTTAGQDMTRARATLKTLTSPEFHGRGYVNQGDRIAADFLKSRFSAMGLKPFGNSYFQPFTLDVNTYPGKVSLKINKTDLAPGKDFLVNPISQKGKGSARIMQLPPRLFTDTIVQSAFLKQNLSRKAIVYLSADYGKFTDNPDLLEKLHTAKALIELQKEKLTATVSTAALSHPTFEIVRKDWDTAAQKIKFRVDAKLIKNYQTQNVVGFVEGKTHPEEFVVITAHYDHLGQLGKDVYFPGANDNASGVTLLLELAQYYAKPENQPEYSIAFIAFAAEEAGLLGSKYYTDHPLFPLNQIHFLINLDLMGAGDEGIMMVNGLRLEQEFGLFNKINEEKHYFTKLQKRDNAPNSDHFFFARKGVKACFFYTLGNPKFYHDIYDRAETLPLAKFPETFGLLTDFIQQYP